MVSTNDLAKQVQFTSRKQEAAETAFKSKHSFDSNDAFKKIFDGISQTKLTVDADKDRDMDPIKHLKLNKHNEKKHAADFDHADETTARTTKQSDHSDKQPKINTATTEKTDQEPACDEQICDEQICDAQNSETPNDNHNNITSNVSTTAKTATEGNLAEMTTPYVLITDQDVLNDTYETPKDILVLKDTFALIDNKEAVSNEPVADADAPVAAEPTQGTDNKLAALAGAVLINPDAAPKVDAKTKLIEPQLAKTAQPATTQPAAVDFQKAIPEKFVSPEIASNTDNEFSSALDDSLETATPAQEPVKLKHEAPKEQRATRTEQLELLQGKNPADITPPAAGDRAISVATKASDSSAPHLNGSAGGSTPITATTDGPAQTVNNLAHLPKAHSEQTSFVATLRGSKEAQIGLMLPTEQVAVHMHKMAKGGASQYDLQLHPAELGRVDVRLDISKDGLVHATISTDNQQTYELLQKDQRSLERALQQAGLQTDSGSLSFNLRSGHGGNTHQHQDRHAENSLNKWMDKTLPENSIQSKVLSFDVTAQAGRVDLRI
jgi:flagellar hook-length control protein FliK